MSLWVWVRVAPALSNLLLATQFIVQLVIVLALNIFVEGRWRPAMQRVCKALEPHWESDCSSCDAKFFLSNFFLMQESILLSVKQATLSTEHRLNPHGARQGNYWSYQLAHSLNWERQHMQKMIGRSDVAFYTFRNYRKGKVKSS